MEYSLGIDLGTTYSAAATAHDDRVEIFQLGEQAATIPSVVVLRADGEVLTGDPADRRSLSEPTRTAREFKRRLGDPTPIILGGTPYGAESLLAHLLRAIVVRVTTELGEPAAAIAVCHPASYGAYKIDLLEQAIRQADLEGVSLLTEPEAAAIHYARQERVPVGAVVAVYDFGGGTFDATILRKNETGFEVSGRPEGMERLGGIDFDAALFERAVAMARAMGADLNANDPAMVAAIARLREECRRAKEALSSDTDATIPIVLPGLHTEMRVTREEFEEIIRPRVHETLEALRRATRSAGLAFDGLDRVLLVGGTSRIPLVAEMVRQATGRPVAVDAHPKHSMALGAAFAAERGRRASLAAGTVGSGAMAGAAVGAGTAAIGAAGVAGPPDGPDPRPPEGGPPAAVPAPTTGGEGPPARVPPPTVTAGGGSGRGRSLAIVGALAGLIVVGGLVLGANGMLPGVGAGASPSLAAVASATPAPTATPLPTVLVSPSAVPLPSPTATLGPTPTPAGRQARIKSITVGGGSYVVDFEVFGYTPVLPGMHVHFFFDTVPQTNAGVPGSGPWFVYATPVPFTQAKVVDKPQAARQMCILAANPDHSVIQGTGNCMDLPA